MLENLKDKLPTGQNAMAVGAVAALIAVGAWWAFTWEPDSGPPRRNFVKTAPSKKPDDAPAPVRAAAEDEAPAAEALPDEQVEEPTVAAAETPDASATGDVESDVPAMTAEPIKPDADAPAAADRSAAETETEPAALQAPTADERKLAEIAANPERYLSLALPGGRSRIVTSRELEPSLTIRSLAEVAKPTARADGWLYASPPGNQATPTVPFDAPGVLWNPLGEASEKPRGSLKPLRLNDPKERALFDPADPRRAVVIADGDLWRARYDWTTDELRRGERLTTLGLFDRLTPQSWVGERMNFENPLDGGGEVSVSLVDGSYTQRPARATPPRSSRDRGSDAEIVTPDGRVRARIDGDLIEFTDLATGQTRVAENVLRYEHPADPLADRKIATPLVLGFAPLQPLPQTRRGKPENPSCLWLNDRQLLTETVSGGLARLDFASATATPVDGPRGVSGVPTEPTVWEAVLGRTQRDDLLREAGGRILLTRADENVPTARGAEENPRVVLLDPVTGGETDRSAPPPDAIWIGGGRYVAAMPTGPLEEVGTWLHDVTAGKKRLLARSTETDSFTLIPGPARLFFRTPEAWFVASLNEPDVRRLEGWDEVKAVSPIGPPVELGLTDGAPDPWEPVETAALFPPESGDLPEQTDRMRVETLTSELPPETRTLVSQLVLPPPIGKGVPGVDPVAYAKRLLAAYAERENARPADLGPLAAEILAAEEADELIDRDRVRVWAFETAMRKDWEDRTPPQTDGAGDEPFAASWEELNEEEREKYLRAYKLVADATVREVRSSPETVTARGGLNASRPTSWLLERLQEEKRKRRLQ
ncbi:MAG: hypothetical protein AAF907_00145 [Planctomycetota bacterium]